ncbi:MAG TPA: TolC family protein [Casimicrobiaceae bacterium]|nr:TolC family protein [Casimicrobiaceae bacterium]
MFSYLALHSLRGASITLAVLFVAGGLSAQPLTFAEALRLAESRAPTLAAAFAAARGARELAAAAGQLPDPVLRAGVDNLPVNGPEAFSLERDFMTMRRIGVTQEYVSTAKRATRLERGEREARRFEAEAAMSRAEARTDVATAWYERLYARRSEQLLQSLVDEIAMQQRAVEAQLASGKTSASDVLMSRAVIVQAQDRVLVARRQQQIATARLARWLGDDANRAPVDDSAPPRNADIAALAEHDVHDLPHLRVLLRQLEVAEADIEMARQNRSPNWSWEASYAQRGSAYSSMISVGVSIPLPIARAQRQDREVEARLAQRDQARELLEDARRRHQAEFNAARVELQALRERQQTLEAALLPLTRQRIDSVLAGYRGGRENLSSVLDARRAEVDARLSILELERDAARLWAQLRHTYFEGDALPAPIARGAKP